jgi:hypothetical protein
MMNGGQPSWRQGPPGGQGGGPGWRHGGGGGPRGGFNREMRPDGKKKREPVVRRTVDFMAPVIKHLMVSFLHISVLQCIYCAVLASCVSKEQSASNLLAVFVGLC